MPAGKSSKNLTANGKGASAYGSHKVKGHQIKNRRRSMRRTWADRIAMGHAKRMEDGSLRVLTVNGEWRRP